MKSGLLVFGGGGQVGRALSEFSSDSRVITMSHAEVDICDASMVAGAISKFDPAAVINAAGYTAVDKAEIERDQVFRVNRDGARVVAKALAETNIPLVHLSTDYVFDGRHARPYVEADQVAPLNVYGESKLEGELAIRETVIRHIIMRTAWVYSPFGKNFVRTMLQLNSKHEVIQVVDDQIGSPTFAKDLAAAIMAVATRAEDKTFDQWGTYHFAGATAVSWYDFAKLIFEEAAIFGIRSPTLRATSSSQYAATAVRPKYSVLDAGKFARVFDFLPRPLRESVAECLEGIFMRGAEHTTAEH